MLNHQDSLAVAIHSLLIFMLLIHYREFSKTVGRSVGVKYPYVKECVLTYCPEASRTYIKSSTNPGIGKG